MSWWYESRDLGQLAPSDNCFKPQLAQNNIVLLFFLCFCFVFNYRPRVADGSAGAFSIIVIVYVCAVSLTKLLHASYI